MSDQREKNWMPNRGRVVPGGTEVPARGRGQIIPLDRERQRAWNAIDAAHMGQEDYRDGKLMSSLERFEQRARNASGLRRLDLLDDLTDLWHFYKDAYQGKAAARRPRS